MIYQKYIKRILDLLFSIILFILIWWIIAVVSIIILLKDGRPVFFLQERIGKDGKPFRIIKFRTMVRNAERIGPKATTTGDPRITPIGSFLRKTSLDEIPQLFNIITGDMSFVGYRPGVYENYEQTDFDSGIFQVKPGITGYAQVNGRSNLTLEEKRAWEIRYTKEISFKTDVLIVLKTIGTVLSRKGSY